MHIERLYLEVTRNCTLECEHCFRGYRQVVNMNTSTIDKIFNDVKKVDFLLLTGGEPFIAIKTLEYLAHIIESKNVRINKIIIITNGTVLSGRIINLLGELSKRSYLILKVSADIFHQLELKRLNLLEKRNKNLRLLDELQLKCSWNIDCSTYLDCDEKTNCYRDISIVNRGKVLTLSEERLAEINSISQQKYIIRPVETDTDTQPAITTYKDKVEGIITVDVNGNIVSYAQSFDEEDEEALEKGLTVNTMSFKDAVNTYIDWYNQELRGKPYKQSSCLTRKLTPVNQTNKII